MSEEQRSATPSGDDFEPAVPGDRGTTPLPEATAPAARREPRPMIERLGLAAVAVVLATLFGGVAVASWVGGEPFLAIMGGIGSLMTLWVGLLTLVRG